MNPLFLAAMMIVIGFMEERRFFEVMVEKALGYLDRRAAVFIVALGILERDKGIHLRFGQWLVPGAVIAIPTLALATALLYLQLPWLR